MSDSTRKADSEDDRTERLDMLRELEDWLQTPMIFLSFFWLVLLIVELVWGSIRLFETFGTIIWVIFIAEFMVRLTLAPGKLAFLRSNWLTIIALAVPAVRLLRAFRLFRVARAARGVRLVRVVGAANRGINALRKSLGRRGLGYVLGTTLLVALLGAAGMLAFEPASEVEGGFKSYGDALWWTGMLLTTIGSAFWPQTVEGRLLCFILSIYGMTVFGYITASLASFFIGQEAKAKESDVAGVHDIAELRREVILWRSEQRQAGPEQPPG
jgi:voltage-gated potassium channel